jgi:hypothetical protein
LNNFIKIFLVLIILVGVTLIEFAECGFTKAQVINFFNFLENIEFFFFEKSLFLDSLLICLNLLTILILNNLASSELQLKKIV